MAAELQQLGAIADRHASVRQSIIVQLIKLLLGLWGDFSDARDDAARLAIAARSASLVGSATSRMRLQSRSHLQSVLSTLGERPELAKLIDPYPRSGVSALEVYERPGKQFLWELSRGASVDEARDAATERLRQIAEDDVLLADRDESQRVFAGSKAKVIGYRRVIHPELAKDGTCGLCLVASQRFYTVEDLLPLHDRCNCTVMPIVKGDDPGFRLNDDDLKALYAAAGSTSARDLLNTRITIREHGELGPVLVKEGDSFRTAKDAGRPEYVKPTPQSIRAANRKARSEADAKMAATVAELGEIPADTTDGALIDHRANLTRARNYLRDYIRALDNAFAALQ